MQNLSRVIITILFFFFLSFPILASESLNVVINEIAWMGNQQSFNNEWIELYNRTDSPIDLDGWTLKATNGTPEINLAGTLLANSYYLLERTDDTTIPEIEADLIYVGALKNDGENLELYDNFENLIDQVYCSSGWFVGNNQTKQTMERKNSQLPGNDSENWQTSQNPGGTPGVKNSLSIQVESQKESQPKEEPIEYPSGIVINEILRPEKETKESLSKGELAAIGQQVSGSSKSLYVFLIALSLAFFSGVIILILKRKIKIDFKKDLE